jgi:hypothetical protein
MDIPIKDDFSNNEYPKSNTNSNTFEFKCNKNHSKLIDNPLINHFTISSFFIYDQIDNLKYFNSLKNKNNIKLNTEEIAFLNKIYDELKILKSVKHGDELITLDSKIYEQINSFFKIESSKFQLAKYLENKIINLSNRAQLSCRKLSNDYYKETGMKVSKSTINNVIRKQLGFHYRKSTLKRNITKHDSGIIANFTFIKTITRCLKLGFIPIFLDESKIELSNNHYKIWLYPNEQLCFNNSFKDKSNLI